GCGVEEALAALELGHLVGLDGDREGARAAQLGVDAEPFDVRLELVEVAQAQLVERVVLLGPAGATVCLAVRERGLAEASVATRGGPSGAPGLEHDDPSAGVAQPGVDRGPQPRVAPADDEQ